MTFNLTTTGSFYSTKQKERLEQLGFEFELEPNDKNFIHLGDWHKTEKSCSITMHSLEDLLEFQKEWGDLILTEDTIQLYDDYNE